MARIQNIVEGASAKIFSYFSLSGALSTFEVISLIIIKPKVGKVRKATESRDIVTEFSTARRCDSKVWLSEFLNLTVERDIRFTDWEDITTISIC